MTPIPTTEEDSMQAKDISNVVHGTAETLLSKLEENVAATSMYSRGSTFARPLHPIKKGEVCSFIKGGQQCYYTMSKQRLINNYCPTILDIKGDDVEDAKEASENEDLEDEEEGEEEDELLQDTDPGPLGCDGKDVEDVLNIISQSIYREGEGIFFIHLSSFLSVAIYRSNRRR